MTVNTDVLKEEFDTRKITPELDETSGPELQPSAATRDQFLICVLRVVVGFEFQNFWKQGSTFFFF